MLVDAILIVDLENCDDERRKSFSGAMSRRGWWKLQGAGDGYRIGIHGATNDEQVVKICERDVRESAYVAGVSDYDATCLISPDEPEGEGNQSCSEFC